MLMFKYTEEWAVGYEESMNVSTDKHDEINMSNLDININWL